VNARSAVVIACLLGGTICAGAVQDAWESSFPVAALTDRNVYFAARYFDSTGTEHRQDVWREGSRRLRRTTDGKLDLLIERDSAGEYQYRLADRTRGMIILADRTSLYRAGIFADWKSAAHALREPGGAYRVVAEGGPSAQVAVGPCSWSELMLGTALAPSSRVCWSQEWGLPFAIQSDSEGVWTTRFSVVEVRIFDPSDAVFALDSAGLVEVDARPGEDISD
jgi:hypothetical protein